MANRNNSQLGYMSYSQSSESYYSERNNSQDGYKLACSDNQDITSYSPEKNKSPQGCKEQPPCIQDTYSSSGGSQGYYYNINNVEYNQHDGYEYGFNHYDYLPNYGDENYDDQTYFNGYKEPFCGSSSQQKPICRSTSSHVSKKLHKNSGIIHVKPNFGSNMYNVDAIHEERAKTQRRTEKLEVMIKIHGALTQLTEQWKIRQKELKELQKELKEFRKEEDKDLHEHYHQEMLYSSIWTNIHLLVANTKYA
ncbi:hypothetical protein Pyn_34085 [Prunus yedoensis var. nudiflora]|uniref:Uncharacterized protein n=1 Tax=Prunus yedoensis var. nudiflora TaxID=2094558 RepID=A0A314XJW2_PRUYE|nr:hypothetical protein Pyn_34085 [Prunus yedoensis var. nudiflora]